MRYAEILDEINKHTWWAEDYPATIQPIIYPMHGFITSARYIHPELLNITFICFKGNYFHERTPEDEKMRQYEFFYEKMRRDKNYLEKAQKISMSAVHKAMREAEKFSHHRTRMSDEDVGKSYAKMMKPYAEGYLAYQAAIECEDIYSQYHLEKDVRREVMLKDKVVMETLTVLTAPLVLSFIEKERVMVLKAAIRHYDKLKKSKRDIALMGDMKKISDSYYFVLTNYKYGPFLDDNHFYQQCEEEAKKGKKALMEELRSLNEKISELRKKKQSLYKRHKMSKGLKLHLTMAETFAEHIDIRKETMLQMNNYIFSYCDEAARRFGVPVDDVKMYTFQELCELFMDGKRVSQEMLEKRKGYGVCVLSLGKDKNVEETWFYGKEAEDILKRTTHAVSEEIKGHVASAPVKKFLGRVQVVLDTAEGQFVSGNILVTTMTRPDFVPLMRKATAIITDEGGITSHAAIVSRELKIPCIIGTRTATKALKDGDVVEMDLETGIVRIVK